MFNHLVFSFSRSSVFILQLKTAERDIFKTSVTEFWEPGNNLSQLFGCFTGGATVVLQDLIAQELFKRQEVQKLYR